MDQRTSSSGGRNSAEAQLRVYNPFLCRTAAELHPPEEETCRRKGCTPVAELPDCRQATPAGLPAVRPLQKHRRQSGSSGRVLRQLNCRRSWQVRRGVLGNILAVQLPECIPLSSMLWFMDFRKSRPKFLFPNSSQPWSRYPPLRLENRLPSFKDNFLIWQPVGQIKL